MKAHGWQQQILRAAADPDGEVMKAMAAHLEACTDAKAILRAKGYGESGQGIDAMVRDVPENFKRLINRWAVTQN